MKNINSFLRWSFLPNKSLIIESLFTAFDFFQSANFFREKDILAATAKGVLKIFHQNLWKTPVKKLIFVSCRLGIYSFTKNEVIHRYSSRILVAPSSDSFTDSHFQVGSFVKHLFCGTKITLIWATLPPPPYAYPPINIEIFSTPPPPPLFRSISLFSLTYGQ